MVLLIRKAVYNKAFIANYTNLTVFFICWIEDGFAINYL